MKLVLPGQVIFKLARAGVKTERVDQAHALSLQQSNARRFRETLRGGALSKHDTDWSIVANQVVGHEHSTRR